MYMTKGDALEGYLAVFDAIWSLEVTILKFILYKNVVCNGREPKLTGLKPKKKRSKK